jgi:hypothetical protein
MAAGTILGKPVVAKIDEFHRPPLGQESLFPFSANVGRK